MRRFPERSRWLPLTVLLALLVSTLAAPASPLLAAPTRAAESPAAKKNAAAAKRLQWQRQHMENQRDRIKTNRQRFKEQKERQRERLKREREEARAQAKENAASKGSKDKDDDGDETEIWSGFFPWATDGGVSDNLLTGLGLAALGVAGALILIFGLLGSYLPSMGGKGEYEALQLEIEALTKRRDKQLAPRERYVRSGADLKPDQRQEAAALTHDLTKIIKSKEAEAQHKYRQVLWLGIPIYVLIGGALAVLLATSALQALLIGFAWTSIAERLGMKREQSTKEAAKSDENAKLEKEAEEGFMAKAALAERDAKIEELTQIAFDATKFAARIKDKP